MALTQTKAQKAKSESKQIEAKPLATHHVFLDTQIYRQYGHNPKNGVLQAFAERVKAKELILHYTDITKAEIRRQVIEMAQEVATTVNKARKTIHPWRRRLPKLLADEIPDFDATKVGTAAFDAFEAEFLFPLHPQFHSASAEGSVEVFRKYFAGESTFRARTSKEFPDAFVVTALAAWCEKNKERIYVIGADAAMAEAVEDEKRLLTMKTLEDLLASVSETQSPKLVNQATSLLAQKSAVKDLLARFTAADQDLIPIYNGGDYAEGEAVDHEVVGPLTILDFTVIAATKIQLSILLTVCVPVSVTISYEDRSSAMYDREDDIYVGAETEETTIEAEPEIRAFIKLSMPQARVTHFEIIDGEFYFSEPYDWE
ncbi:PIN domain-containing protein [Bosea vaviloviae]|nr:PIN domain-containing protein [Bosea vaviloviae]